MGDYRMETNIFIVRDLLCGHTTSNLFYNFEL